MKKVLCASLAALAIALPGASAFAHDGDYYRDDFYHRLDHREHERFHEEFNELHNEAHEEGFANGREHRDWHRAYQQTHRDFHDEHPYTWHDHGYRRYQPNGWYTYGSPFGSFSFDFYGR